MQSGWQLVSRRETVAGDETTCSPVLMQSLPIVNLYCIWEEADLNVFNL